MPVTRPASLSEFVPLAGLSTLGVGGPARYYVSTATVEGVAEAVSWARAEGRPLLFLGGGSNLVVSDEGFPGLVVHLRIPGVQAAPTNCAGRLTAGAGEARGSALCPVGS